MDQEDICEYCTRVIWLWSDKMWHDGDDKVDCSLATGYGCHFPLSQALPKTQGFTVLFDPATGTITKENN